MNGRAKKPGKNLSPPESYEVGYCRPPMETRFRPGQSGNPRGRPKGSKNKRPGLHEERMKDIILDESYRGIAVQDGDRKVTVPMAQAVMRSIAVNAAKGNWRCQRLFAELLASTESSRRALNDQWLDTAIGYKVEWERELRRRENLGITGLPEPLPHPDHVEIDFELGTAKIIGPRTKEEKAELDEVIANKHLLVDELKDLYDARAGATAPKELRRLDREIEKLMEFIGFINRLAPREVESVGDDDEIE